MPEAPARAPSRSTDAAAPLTWVTDSAGTATYDGRALAYLGLSPADLAG